MQAVKIFAIVMTGTLQMYGERRLLVSLNDHKMVVLSDGQVVKTYPVAVGKASTPSPTGTFSIVNRVVNPTWFGPGGNVVQPGPGNPLGTRWMGLSLKGFGIHGTNVQSSVGKSASHGCIRMRKHDVEELFGMVAVGDTVELMSQVPAEIKPLFDGTPAPVTASVTAVSEAGGAE